MEKKERIAWVDVSRGLAFLVVIYCHLPQSDPSVMKFFSPIFLTTFFFVSGYLYKSNKPFSEVLEQRVRTLLLPFIILGLAMVVMSHILSFHDSESFSDGLKGLLLQNGENQILWFVAALFVYSIIFYFVDYFCRTSFQLIVVSVSLFVINCITLHYLDWYLPWHLLTVGFGCFYMALGKLYRKYEDLIDSKIKWWMVLLGCIFYVSLIILVDKEVNYNGTPIIIDAMALTLIGIVIIITISKKLLKNSRLLLFVGANSLFYFAFHGKVYSVILTVLEKVSPEIAHEETLFYKTAIALGVVLLDAIILIPPTLIVNKYFPQIFGKRFKIW